MIVLLIIFGFILSLIYISIIMSIIHCACIGEIDLDEVFNPVVAYRNSYKLNIFGAILYCLLMNIILAPIAPFYWIYWLCTF